MYIQGKKIMPPPWLAYPHIERGSIRYAADAETL